MPISIRKNIITDYTLHDMNVISIEKHGRDLIMRTQSGIVKCEGLSSQVNGHVVFRNVDMDFSNVYLMKSNGRYGSFEAEKITLEEFLTRYPVFGFSISDEVYGYNQTKYWGYLSADREFYECIIEFYHLGDMIFVEE